MTKILAVGLALVTPALASAQAPQIQNGKVETRKAAAIDREIASLLNRADEATWVAWKAPMIDGDRDMCSWYNDRLGSVRGWAFEDNVVTVGGALVPQDRPKIAPATGPVPLEAGTSVVIFARVIGGAVERLRTVGDDCPIDAGGRTVVWLDGVTPAESLRYLATLVRGATPERDMIDSQRNVAETAVRAIGYHRDPGADAALDQIGTSHRDGTVRRQAARTLASLRGAKGVASVLKMIAAEKDAAAKRSLVSSLGGSRDASAVEALRGLAKDPDPKLRSEAVYYFIRSGGSAVMPEALKFVSSDTDESVRRRAVTAIGSLPADTGITPLIQIARTSTDAGVKKEAVRIISESRDPRAIAFIDEILKK